MTRYTSEEIKNRLSNIGEAIGVIALEHIEKVENENEHLKQQIEQMKNCLNCKFGDLGEDDIWCYNRERHGFYDAKKGCKHWELAE